MGKLQTGARNQGQSGAVDGAIQTVFAPISGFLSGVADGIGDFADGIFSAGEITEENRRLRALESAAALYEEQSARYEAEIARLRTLLKLPAVPGKTKIPAAVVGYFPFESRITLSAGSDQGVRKGMPVVAAQGMVGTVQTVNAKTCQVLLISSPQQRLVGKIERDPAPIGFIRGMSASAMNFEVLDAQSIVQNGDTVITSGFSDKIPAGIPIGKVVQIEEDVAYGSKRCQVFPGVQIGSIREVFILK